MTTTTVLSPVRYTQVADGPIRSEHDRALIEGTTTHTLVAQLMADAKAHALVTGTVDSTYTETVHGVVIEAKWMREQTVEDDEREPDIEFSLDAVVAGLHERGIPAYVEMTGGGCATIYAGGQHVMIDGGIAETRWDVSAGPGSYRHGADSTALLAEFYVGPSDDEGSQADTLPDHITEARVAVEWAVEAIASHAATAESRSFFDWNKRPCKHCRTTVVPGPNGTWVTLDLTACPEADAHGQHDAY